jgi:hypothetical protein
VRELIAGIVSAALACAACGPRDASLVVGYPWIEHARLALVEETLTITVRDDAIEVDGWFRFDGEGALPTQMDFPIGRSDGALIDFAATMETEGDAPIALVTTPSSPSALPVDGATESRLVDLPPNHDAHRTRLRVHYRQSATRTFRYVLQSGAYWSGPIRSLRVTVRDPAQRIDAALVEGRTPDRIDADAFEWTFVDLEPRGGVVLTVEARAS